MKVGSLIVAGREDEQAGRWVQDVSERRRCSTHRAATRLPAGAASRRGAATDSADQQPAVSLLFRPSSLRVSQIHLRIFFTSARRQMHGSKGQVSAGWPVPPSAAALAPPGGGCLPATIHLYLCTGPRACHSTAGPRM